MFQATRTTAIAIFPRRTEAEAAIDALRAVGFSANQVALLSCALPCPDSDKDLTDPALVAAEGAGIGAAAGVSYAGLVGGTIWGLFGDGLLGALP